MHDSFYQIDKETIQNSEVAEQPDLSDSSEDENFEMINEPPVKLLIEPTLAKIRQIVKYFKKSPLKNDLLQKLIFDRFKKELKLILDCRTRWNSICPMIDRFILLKECIDELSPIKISDEEIKVLKVILKYEFCIIRYRM